MIQKSNLKEDTFVMNVNNAVMLVEKKTSDDISTFRQ